MDYCEMYEALRYIISCRKCGGRGGAPGQWDVEPCPICQTAGLEQNFNRYLDFGTALSMTHSEHECKLNRERRGIDAEPVAGALG